MKKLYKILLIAVLLVIILILALRFVQTPKYKFAKDLSTSFVDYAEDEYIITPNVVAKTILEEDSKTILVDIRNKHDYTNGHILGAKHIAKETILDDENYKFFKNLKKNDQKVILYGADVVEANIPFMILKQMGIENIGISSKGYDFFANRDLNKTAISEVDYSKIEIPVADFAKYIKDTNEYALEKIRLAKEKKKVVAKRVIPIKKKTIVTKPKPAEPVEEEDEGC